MNILVFDIETIPDVISAKRLHELQGLSDLEVADALFHMRRQETGRDFLRLHLQRIVAISLVYVTESRITVLSLKEVHSSEKELVQAFFSAIDHYRPTLVSWNGGGFDLPVLHYRAMLHGISAGTYWDLGEKDPQTKWNNYISRYHFKHTDLMDVLALYQPKACVSLDEMASLLGFPGKLDMSGARVWDQYQKGEIESIRAYCETDVLNTYLIYLRFCLFRGTLNEAGYIKEIERLKTYLKEQISLKEQKNAHLQQFLSVWESIVV